MKKYLIKTTSIATERNPNFFCETHEYLIAKNLCTPFDEAYLKFYAKEYGYNSLGGAKARLRSCLELNEWENNKGFWKTNSEIITVEI